MTAVPQWIVDTDAGVDDAVALLAAFSQPQIEWTALTSVSGNAPVEMVTKNLGHLLDWSGKDVPVYQGAARPMFREPLRSLDFMGADGLGGATASMPPLRHAPQPEKAPMVLAKLVKASSEKGEVVLVAIGPLTNLALAVRLAPEMVSQVDRLVIMGGSVHAQGNTSSVAEFNIFSDPEAASIIFNAGFRSTWLVPWETCVKHALPWAEYERLCAQQTSNARLFQQLTGTTELFLRQFGLPGIILSDLLAVAVALDPTIAIEAPEVSVAVDISKGVGHGLTAVDWYHSSGKQPNMRVVETLDAQRAYSFLTQAIQAY